MNEVTAVATAALPLQSASDYADALRWGHWEPAREPAQYAGIKINVVLLELSTCEWFAVSADCQELTAVARSASEALSVYREKLIRRVNDSGGGIFLSPSSFLYQLPHAYTVWYDEYFLYYSSDPDINVLRHLCVVLDVYSEKQTFVDFAERPTGAE